MTNIETRKLSVLDTASAEFERMARTIELPGDENGREQVFRPAFASFTIGGGPTVDISHLHVPADPNPLSQPKVHPVLDRHDSSEELWMVQRGDLVVAMAEGLGDPPKAPNVQDLLLFHVQEGEIFVLRTGVWHGAVWAARPNVPVNFLMILSGHRQDTGGNLVDHTKMSYSEDAAIAPDQSSPAITRT